MTKMQTIQSKDFGYKFIDGKYLPEGKDEYYFRFLQTADSLHRFRHLFSEEIERLIKNGNTSANWDDILVEDPFNTDLIKNNCFAGLVRISAMENFYLKYHDFAVPVGISNSRIISCDIGANCAVHSCSYLSHYIIGKHCILNRIDEMTTTNHSKFGEGLVKDGEEEAVRVTIAPINEAGGREVFPFCDMISADAFLWAVFRDDTALMEKLKSITQNSKDSRRGYYGIVGEQSVIKSCRIIKDVNFGECVYIKGANKLKNLTVKSTQEEPSQIGEGVELINGIIGLGSRVFYGAKAVRFLMGNNCELKYGARLIHSILGDNSTISCCEVLNALIFPYHEQHHNNSFLIAALIKGQSNMAAGATVGSNHNTRGNDGEIIAGRGFWPGLSSTLKHNCRFASFVILAKGNYMSELSIPFPFSLVMDNTHENMLEVMPAYYWMYNMYALQRNNKKFVHRDKRKTKTQHIETNFLAPDTVSELLQALTILGDRIEATWFNAKNEKLPAAEIVSKHFEEAKTLFVTGENIERSKRTVKILKAVESYEAYIQMLTWYGVTVLTDYFDKNGTGFTDFQHAQKPFRTDADIFLWENIGGQLIPQKRLRHITDKIKTGVLKTWSEIHCEYDAAYAHYEADRAENAYSVLCKILNLPSLNAAQWNSLLDNACGISDYIAYQTFYTKNKDYNNYFRGITYSSEMERRAVLGDVNENPLIREVETDSRNYKSLFKRFKV